MQSTSLDAPAQINPSLKGRRIVVTREHFTLHAGAKAPCDIRQVCLDLGFEPVNLPPVPLDRLATSNVRRFVSGGAKLGRLALSLGSDDAVLIQYPLVGRMEKKILPKVCSKAWAMCLVHDLDVIRNPENLDYDDLDVLSHFDVVIAHNARMKDYLIKHLPGVDVVSIDIFDYLKAFDGPPPVRAARPDCIYIIGNLHPMKATYLYSLSELPTRVIAYGPNCARDKLTASVDWRGVLDMHHPSLEAVEGFGLVWDGISAEGLEGEWGRYLHYNTPHKLSMYMILGMPVIVSADSAMADFVRTQEIGLVVESIPEAAKRIMAVPPGDWERMIARTQVVRAQLSSGHYTRTAVEKALRTNIAR